MKVSIIGSSIKSRLILLVVCCVVPSAIAAGLHAYQAYQRERAIVTADAIDVARAMARTMDRELTSAIAASLALSTSPYLASGNLAAFHEQAKRALQYQSGNNFVLSDATGQQLMNTLRPYGAVLPPHGNLPQMRRVFETGQPMVSDIFEGGVARRPLIAVDVPVHLRGRIAYVLSTGFFPERLVEILARQNVDSGRIVSIFDGTGRIISRTHASEQWAGREGNPALIARIKETEEGSIEIDTRQGVPVVAAFSRLTASGWSVAIYIPQASLMHGLRRSLELLLAGTAVFLGASLVLAYVLGARITKPIRSLIAPALALGRGERIEPRTLRLREAQDVADALVEASNLLQKHIADEREAIRQAAWATSSETFQRSIFDESPDGILVVDKSGQIIRANARADALFGYYRGTLIGRSVNTLLPRPLRERHAAHLAKFFSAPHRRPMGDGLQLAGVRADETEFPVDITLSPFHAESETLVIAIVRDITERKAQEARIATALAEKETLLKEVYHRVKNNLQLVTSLLNLQMRTLHKGAARDALHDSIDRVRAMSLVHEKLYQGGDLSSVALADYVGDLCRHLADAAGASSRIQFSWQVDPIEIGLEKAIPLGLLLNELLSNSLKHAFPVKSKGTISVRIERRERDSFAFVVSDNGIGLPPGFRPEATETLGMKLIASLAAQLGGRVVFEVDGGTRASGTFEVRSPGRVRRDGIDAAATATVSEP